MKTLTFEQMETTSAGTKCGRIGGIFGAAAMVLMIGAMVTNPVTLVGGLVLAHSISFGIVAGGCSIVDIIEG